MPDLLTRLTTRATWEARAMLRPARNGAWPIDHSPPSGLMARWDEIESERTKLRNSGRSLEYLDFGAGRPGDLLRDEPVSKMVEISDTLDLVNLDLPYRRALSLLAYESEATRILELGTSLGISSSYMAAGAIEAANGEPVTVRTLDGAPALGAEAREFWRRTGYDSVCEAVIGPFSETLATALDGFHDIDLVFIDGHHDGVATVHYFEMIRQHCKADALIVFDDISNYASMRQAWSLISQHHSVADVIDLRVIGAVRLGTDPGAGPVYKKLT